MQNSLEATASQKCGVNHLGPVGCSDHNHALHTLNSVHATQQLVDDTVHHVRASTITRPSHSCYALKLV